MLLDNCCSCQVTNLACLLDEGSIVVNDSDTANTLAGKYVAPFRGDSRHVGRCLLDEEIGFSVMSYHHLLSRNQIQNQSDENFYVIFPTINVRLHFSWVEGILAGSCLPLAQALEASRNGTSMPTINEHYTQREADFPSDLMSQIRVVTDMSKSKTAQIDNVHQAMRAMYSPSESDLRKRIENEMINVDFDQEAITNYFKIFQHELGALKSRTEDERVHHKSNINNLRQGQVLLSGDIMSCGRCRFNVMVLVTPGEIRTSMVLGDLLLDHKQETLTASIIKIATHVQQKYGVEVAFIEFDRQSELHNYVAKSQVETELRCTIVFVSTHACFAESAIKHIKARVRAKLVSLLYNVPRTILLYIVIAAINNLNLTTRSGNGGKSAHLVLTGKKISYKSYFALSPSDLTEVHVQSDNDVLHYRSVTAIPLIPNHNNHSDWTFYSLETGHLFVRDYRHARKVPWSYEARLRMKYLTTLDPINPDDATSLRQSEIPRLLHEMRKHSRQSRQRRTRPRRANQQAVQQADHNNNRDEEQEMEADAEEVIDHAVDNDDIIEPVEPAPDPPDIDAIIAATTMLSEDQHSLQAQLSDMFIFPNTEELLDLETLRTSNQSEVGVYKVYSTTLHKRLNPDIPEMQSKERSSTHVTHKPFLTFRDTIMITTLDSGQKEVSNLGLGVDIANCSVIDYLSMREGYLFSTQVTARNALKTFGLDGIKAIRKEIDGLLQKKVFTGVLIDGLSATQRKKVIRMSCFLKEKRDSRGAFIKLKARLVAGGHMQDRTLFNQDQTSSPTVSTSSIFSIISTGISESRSFMTFDISMAYLNAEMTDEVYMTLDPAMTKILLEQDKTGEFKECLKDGRATVKLNKALYGCVQSARLWYNYLSKFLFTIGFTANPVDPCVFNRITSTGKQTTLAIHVDDGLTTSEDLEDLALLGRQLKEKFDDMECSIAEDKFEYLGMQIDISDGEKAILTMEKYVADIIDENDVTTTAETPASGNLFTVGESPVLKEDERQCFHRVVAQLLYLATRTRPDILLPITFLCSRVTLATEEDKGKLRRVLSYLHNTRKLGIVLGCKGEGVSLSVYADASYAVHGDYKSHGGVFISHNRGPVLVKCSKQKIVTKSSTEAELVTLSDAVSLAAHNIEFLKGQGYSVNAVLQQDNTSTISLAENGRSNSDRTKHIGIRYFFVKQYIENGTMKIQHCPTLQMIADILTKPLQGELFRRLRDLLLGYTRAE
jgi:hypothetical protein